MPTAKPKTSGVNVQVIRPKIKTVKVEIVGRTSLIMNKFSKKAEDDIAARQRKGTQQLRPERDPEAECKGALWTHNGKTVFPGNAFKLAMIEAAGFVDWMTKVRTKGAFFVIDDFVEIKGKWHMRTDHVRVPPRTGRADIRYRPEFPKWSAILTIEYDETVISLEQLLTLLEHAGDKIGIGEQRPSAPMKPMSNGRFKIKARR